MVLRELIVSLRLRTREADVQKAHSTIAGLKSALGGLAGFFGVRMAFRGLTSLVMQGSEVRETLNLMKETFKEFTPEVLAWSEAMGETLGRSKFLLQGFASSLQAMLVPMTQNREQAAAMSMTLSELAVDLASFFNTTEKEALTAIRAGLAGEVEPLRRRFGIVLTERAMASFAKTTVNAVRNMSEMERTTLRFRFIMARSKDAQGDAIRTQHEFANVARKTKDKYAELGKVIGMDLIPDMTLLVGTFQEVGRSMIGLIQNTSTVASSFQLLGIGSVLTGSVIAASFIKAHPAILTVAAALGAVFLAFDELKALADTDVLGYFEEIFQELGLESGEDFAEFFMRGALKIKSLLLLMNPLTFFQGASLWRKSDVRADALFEENMASLSGAVEGGLDTILSPLSSLSTSLSGAASGAASSLEGGIGFVLSPLLWGQQGARAHQVGDQLSARDQFMANTPVGTGAGPVRAVPEVNVALTVEGSLDHDAIPALVDGLGTVLADAYAQGGGG